MGSFWKITTLAFDLPGGETYKDDNIDISPPETENWTPTERKRKRNPLLFLPGDDNSIKFFEKGLHETVNRPETERNLTPYGSKLSWVTDRQKLKRGAEVYDTDTGEIQKVIKVGTPSFLYDWAKRNLKNEFYHSIKDLIDGDLVSENEEYCITRAGKAYYDMLPLDRVELHITENTRLAWGTERSIWVTHWAIAGNQAMNPTNVQQDWTVVVFYPDDDYKAAFNVIKERFKAYVRQNFSESSEEGAGYMWADAKLWNVQSEKSKFLDKYLTSDEIKNLKEDSILVIDKKDFPVQISNPIERF